MALDWEKARRRDRAAPPADPDCDDCALEAHLEAHFVRVACPKHGKED